MLITGIPSSSLSCAKCGISAHGLGIIRLMTSTGMAEMYSSASMMSPLAMARCFTEPSSLSTNSLSRCFVLTEPPFFSIESTMGAHNRSGWLPSKKAICKPSVSFKNRFIAVNTTVIESLSGSMKSKALAMEMKTSSLMRSGMPYFRIKSCTLSSSCLSMKSCPSINMGNSGGAVCNFSGKLNIF